MILNEMSPFLGLVRNFGRETGWAGGATYTG